MLHVEVHCGSGMLFLIWVGHWLQDDLQVFHNWQGHPRPDHGIVGIASRSSMNLWPKLVPCSACRWWQDCHIRWFGWWFGTCFIFPYIGNNHPNWLIFVRWVETTNQWCSYVGVFVSSDPQNCRFQDLGWYNFGWFGATLILETSTPCMLWQNLFDRKFETEANPFFPLKTGDVPMRANVMLIDFPFVFLWTDAVLLEQHGDLLNSGGPKVDLVISSTTERQHHGTKPGWRSFDSPI